VIVGYARVSTDGQTLDAQQSALAAAGAEKVFAEKVSGAVTDRKALTRAIAALDAGDVLLVTRGWTGWRAAPGTSSTCWTRWRKPVWGFGRWRMPGQIRRHRTGG
jgi:Resolvase, N terminal domain